MTFKKQSLCCFLRVTLPLVFEVALFYRFFPVCMHGSLIELSGIFGNIIILNGLRGFSLFRFHCMTSFLFFIWLQLAARCLLTPPGAVCAGRRCEYVPVSSTLASMPKTLPAQTAPGGLHRMGVSSYAARIHGKTGHGQFTNLLSERQGALCKGKN